MKIKNAAVMLAVLLLCIGMANSSAAVTLTVGDSAGYEEQTVNVDVMVDDPLGIAGASFTVTYDSANVTLTNVESTFFDTFAQQWAELDPQPDPLPPNSVTVDSVEYTQPLLSNDVPGTGTLVAAARVTAETNAANTVLFTLSFVLNDGSSLGTYDVEINATTLNNTDAGYDAGGETIPLLIGADPSVADLTDPLAFPIIMAAPGTVVDGSVTFAEIPDVDGDGIDDNWEIATFGDLVTADATSDYDQDGYTDKQEWLNKDINDPDGNPFDPVGWKNAAGGDGYDDATVVQPGDLDGDESIDFDEVRSTFTFFTGQISPSPQQFAAANVCDDGDGHTSISLNDVRGVFRLFAGHPTPCQ
jgi:hypothetical protein